MTKLTETRNAIYNVLNAENKGLFIDEQNGADVFTLSLTEKGETYPDKEIYQTEGFTDEEHGWSMPINSNIITDDITIEGVEKFKLKFERTSKTEMIVSLIVGTGTEVIKTINLELAENEFDWDEDEDVCNKGDYEVISTYISCEIFNK